MIRNFITQAKRHRLLAALSAIIFSTMAWLALNAPPREPMYQGKPLNFWIDQYGANANITPRTQKMDDEEAAAKLAIHAIGSNAFPSLLEWAGYQDSSFQLELRRFIVRTRADWLTELRLKFSPDTYHTRAIYAFDVLRAEGSPAIPGLIHLLDDSSGEVQITAMHCLERIGSAAAQATPALLRCLQGTNNMARYFAIRAVGNIHAEPTSAIPALLSVLQNEPKDQPQTKKNPSTTEMLDITIFALGKYGPKAQASVPLLLPLLNDPQKYIRSHTSNALKRIDPEAAAKAGVK